MFVSAEDYFPEGWEIDGNVFWPYLRRANRPIVPRPKCIRCRTVCSWAQVNGRWMLTNGAGEHKCPAGSADDFDAVPA